MNTEVLERVYEPRRLREAWHQIRRNAGAAGIDRMTVEEFEKREEEFLKLISEKLKAGTYRFKPARRVLIPKEGSNKMRPLRISGGHGSKVSQSINLVFEVIFDPAFTRSNFRFGGGHSQHQAIRHVQGIVEDGYDRRHR